MNKRFSLESIMSRLGERYIVFSVAAAQLVALLGAIPGVLSIRANASFNDAQVNALRFLVPVSVFAAYFITLAISWRVTSTARKRLVANLKNDTRKFGDREELDAWVEITSHTWKYGISALITAFLILILPPYLVSLTYSGVISSPFQPNSLNSPTPLYILLGGAVSALGYVILSLLIVERLTLPVRLILLPKDFETQIKGRAGALLVGKFQVLILALILIGILLVAPISYQQTVRILYSEVSSFEIFSNLQSDIVFFSLLALTLGVGFSYFMFRAVSDPIKALIKTFDKIELGDLSSRVPVIATDELGVVAMQFNRMVSRLESFQETLEKQVAERTSQLTALNEVGRVASSSLDPNELVTQVIKLFTERFGYYFAALYLVDPSEKWAELFEATGDAGHVLKQAHHRLEIAGRSMVGTAIREKSARIAQIASQEKQRIENPLLPYTKSEIVLPLMAGDRVLGALNVQSTREDDFNSQVIETMQNMAGQVSIAFENARLYQEAQQNIREMRSIQKQYLFETWNQFLTTNEEIEYTVGDRIDAKARKIEVPLNLRDQVLGEIMLENSTDLTPEQETLVNAVATQAAVALENARLVNESRQIALRERMLAEINSKIWSSVTIEGVLQTVAKELGRRLDASYATVELKVEEKE